MAWNDSFAAMLSADLESSFIGDSEFADSVVYHSVGGDECKTIDCQASIGQARIADESNHVSTVTVLNVLCHKNATTGIECPKMGDSVTWGDREWDYMLTKGDDGAALTLQFQEVKVNQYGHQRGGQM